MVHGDPEAAVLWRASRAFDGHQRSLSRLACYQGGILGDFFGGYWWNQNRIINRHPANGAPAARAETATSTCCSQQHPTYDDFWRERSACERLDEIKVPVYSIGIWGKVDLHTRGNIDGFRRAKGPQKLRMFGPTNACAAQSRVSSVAFHEKHAAAVLRCYLKGKETDYSRRPAVEYFVRGADAVRSAETWPPARRALSPAI